MTGPMPSLLPGYSRWTALASTCAAEWRMTSRSAPLLPLWLICVEPPRESKRPTRLGTRGLLAVPPKFRLDCLGQTETLWCANNGALPWSASGPPNERGRSPPGSPVVFACAVPRDLHYFPLAEGRLTRLL